jgi:hypothetical protein
VVLTVTAIASLVKAGRDPSARAHAGSLRATRPTAPRTADDRGQDGSS